MQQKKDFNNVSVRIPSMGSGLLRGWVFSLSKDGIGILFSLFWQHYVTLDTWNDADSLAALDSKGASQFVATILISKRKTSKLSSTNKRRNFYNPFFHDGSIQNIVERYAYCDKDSYVP